MIRLRWSRSRRERLSVSTALPVPSQDRGSATTIWYVAVPGTVTGAVGPDFSTLRSDCGRTAITAMFEMAVWGSPDVAASYVAVAPFSMISIWIGSNGDLERNSTHCVPTARLPRRAATWSGPELYSPASVSAASVMASVSMVRLPEKVGRVGGDQVGDHDVGSRRRRLMLVALNRVLDDVTWLSGAAVEVDGRLGELHVGCEQFGGERDHAGEVGVADRVQGDRGGGGAIWEDAVRIDRVDVEAHHVRLERVTGGVRRVEVRQAAVEEVAGGVQGVGERGGVETHPVAEQAAVPFVGNDADPRPDCSRWRCQEPRHREGHVGIGRRCLLHHGVAVEHGQVADRFVRVLVRDDERPSAVPVCASPGLQVGERVFTRTAVGDESCHVGESLVAKASGHRGVVDLAGGDSDVPAWSGRVEQHGAPIRWRGCGGAAGSCCGVGTPVQPGECDRRVCGNRQRVTTRVERGRIAVDVDVDHVEAVVVQRSTGSRTGADARCVRGRAREHRVARHRDRACRIGRETRRECSGDCRFGRRGERERRRAPSNTADSTQRRTTARGTTFMTYPFRSEGSRGSIALSNHVGPSRGPIARVFFGIVRFVSRCARFESSQT